MRTWLEKAKAFVQEKFQYAHIKKDPLAHALEVFRILREEFGIADTEILTAGILHDVLEDTRATEEEVRNTFSARTAELVKAVSHDSAEGYDREAFYERLKSIPLEAKWIKLADVKANLEWMLERLQAGSPIFHSHDPYVRHVKSFLDSCLDPSLRRAAASVFNLCRRIERLEHRYLRREDLVAIGDI